MSTRRDEIVAIARDLFATRGYTATSMREIAEAADLLAGSLYSHFRSKAHLLELVILPFYDELIPGQRAALAAEGTGAERTAEMLRRVVSTCAAHDAELTILHYDWGHLRGMDELDTLIARSAETLELWEQVLGEGRADGSLRTAASTTTSVRVITSAIHGVLDRRRYADLPPPEGGTDPAAVADELVAVLLGGLGVASVPA